MVSLDSARRYARGMTGCRNPQLTLTTQTGHPDFPEAAAEARGPSVSFAATKLPFVTSRLRPPAAGRRFGRGAVGGAASLRLLPDSRLVQIGRSGLSPEPRRRAAIHHLPAVQPCEAVNGGSPIWRMRTPDPESPAAGHWCSPDEAKRNPGSAADQPMNPGGGPSGLVLATLAEGLEQLPSGDLEPQSATSAPPSLLMRASEGWEGESLARKPCGGRSPFFSD